MWRLRLAVPLVAFLMQLVEAQPTSAKPKAVTGDSPECFHETILPPDKVKGIVIRDKIPDGFDPAKPCRTILRSPVGKMLNITLEVASLKPKRDFVRIKANDEEFMTNETCAPCFGEVIESNAIIIDFLLTNRSKFYLKYEVIDIVCPLLKINSPMFVAGEAPVKRAIGSKLHLECIGKKSFELVGAKNLSCEAKPNGLASWSAPLPSCRKISNCPQVQQLNETSGLINFHHRRNENYDCSWLIGASDWDVNHIKFTPKFRSIDLIPPKGSRSTRGLSFRDGKGRLYISGVSGKRHKTRDSKLKIYFKLSAEEIASVGDASFSVRYDISRKTCPALPDDSFPFGTITRSDSNFAGSTAEFLCAANYKLVGKSEAMCTSGGYWTFEKIPECVLLTDAESNVNDIATTLKPDELETTTENVPVVTESSTRNVVTTDTHMEEERSEVTEDPLLDQKPSHVTTVPPKSSTKKTKKKDQKLARIGSTTTNAPAVIEVTTELPTSTEPSTTTEDSTVTPRPTPTPEPGNGTSTELPVFEWIKSTFERLRSLDMEKQSDKLFLYYTIAVVAASVLLLVLCILSLKHCCGCGAKKREILLRENPLYAGTPLRRNISFKMPYGAYKKNAPNKRSNNNDTTDGDGAPTVVAMEMKAP